MPFTENAAQARRKAEGIVLNRRHSEQLAIQAAQQTRRAERELQNAERDAQTAEREALLAARAIGPGDENDSTPVTAFRSLQQVALNKRQQLEGIRAKIENLRQTEATRQQEVLQLEQEEKLAREEQFRREVAAAKTDPDTYAPGNPDSQDPVAQVSASVIGEGLIHLRGPLKGINIIRRAISQIDSPVGQTRIGIHTFQINGERGNHMDVVAEKIQEHLDQSRFLTMRCSEMMRLAVYRVAQRTAEQASVSHAGRTQADRDARYLYGFFGQDFVDELASMDSEFLRTGNKLLSLHSMQTTSLASALGILSLAKNSKRHEILLEFKRLIGHDLPNAESRFIQEGVLRCCSQHHGGGRHPRTCPHCPQYVPVGAERTV